MPTVTGVRICMYPVESTGNREEEWYRARFLLFPGDEQPYVSCS